MNFLIVFTTLVAVAWSHPSVKTWTLTELSDAIEKPGGDTVIRKYLIDALNQIMYALFTGNNEEAVHAIALSPSGNRKWTLEELETALAGTELSVSLRPYFERSYHYLLNDKPKGSENNVEVVIPALDISTWSVSDISDALEDPNTKTALKPFLEVAKEEIKKQMETGVVKEQVILVTPVGLIPAQNGEKPIIVLRKL